jgi:hypothetical protein
MLFVELALIRWLGAQVVYLSYFSNFVLLGSFLGIGLGFLRAHARTNLFRWAPFALLALVLFVSVFQVEIDRSDRELIFFGASPSGPPIWVMLPLVFLAVAAVMMTIGEGVARTFTRFEPLEAYRLDILGSIAGIVGFSALSFLRSPPIGWAVIAALLLLFTLDRPLGVLRVGAVASLVVILAAGSFLPSGLSWSPYYEIHTFRPKSTPNDIAINVNGIPHQTIIHTQDRLKEIVDQPYVVGNAHPAEVLIVGAGSGNDVAIALANGAQHIDAIEIDPRIHEIGVERHPDHPYQDPRVEVHIDDGRAYLERTSRHYDLIILALPDSLTLVSGQSSLRLESYLFTKEAFTGFRDHLKPGGIFSMYNVYREPWLRDRYAGSLLQVFGVRPCISAVGPERDYAALTVGDATVLHCQETWQSAGSYPPPATDDHPFPYLRENTIPPFYLLTIGLILVGTIVLIFTATRGGPRAMRPYVDLFAMGAAFLLLETKSVVQFALLFGTTWFVNALVFLGVLVSVYLAIEVSMRVTLRRPLPLYAALLASLAVAWLVPLSSLLSLDPPMRFAAAVALTFAPVFLANLIFAQRFRDVGSSTAAFGANLLGAMVGGLVEYSALVFGYRSLLIIVAALYTVAFLTRGVRTATAG